MLNNSTKLRKQIIPAVLILVVTCLPVLGYCYYNIRHLREEGLGESGVKDAGHWEGRDSWFMQIVWAANYYHQTRIIALFENAGTPDPWQYQIITTCDPGKNPPPLRQGASVFTHYPIDPEASGIWIHGIRQDLLPGVNFFYFTNGQNAVRIPVADSEQDAIVEDAKFLEPRKFKQKWISPRVLQKTADSAPSL